MGGNSSINKEATAAIRKFTKGVAPRNSTQSAMWRIAAVMLMAKFNLPAGNLSAFQFVKRYFHLIDKDIADKIKRSSKDALTHL